MSSNPADIISYNKARYLTNPGNIMRFPDDDIPYKMLLNFKEYAYTSTTAVSSLISPSSNISAIDNGSIILPLPLQLNDNTNIEAQEVSSTAANFIASSMELKSTGTAGLNFNGMQNLGLDEIQVYTRLMSSLGLSGLASKALKGVPGEIIGALGGTAELLNGKAVNPFQTMQFKGVNLKQHSFNWKLSPSTAKESVYLKNIIEKIKGNILPSYVTAAGPTQFGAHALLKYPAIAMISFYGIDQDYYYKLKPAIITDFNVSYNGGEQLNIYRGGKPAVIDIAMKLTEMSIHTAEDYGGTTYVDVPNTEFTIGELAQAGTNFIDGLTNRSGSEGRR